MLKFEYKIGSFLYNEDREKTLNKHSQKGWVLNSITEYGTDNQSCFFYIKSVID